MSFGRPFPGKSFGRMGAGSGSAFLPESLALFAAMAPPPSDARKQLINATILALKAGGVWDPCEVIYVTAAHASQPARLNWKSPSILTLGTVNAPSFTVDRGYISDGSSSYLTTGYIPAAGRQNDNHLGVWTESAPGGAGRLEVGSGAHFVQTNNAGNFGSRNFAGTTELSATVNSGIGDFLTSRSSDASYSRYANAVAQAAGVQASGVPDGFQLFVCARDASGTPDNFNLKRVAAVTAGKFLSAAQVTARYNAFLTYMQAVGVV
jgi:hypothetical protein